jgi:hypothetical protein
MLSYEYDNTIIALCKGEASSWKILLYILYEYLVMAIYIARNIL